jgi:FAD:protein FMN transferase
MKQHRATKGRSLLWLVANGLVAIVILIGLARVDNAGVASKRSKTASITPREVERARKDWWETDRAIYNEIPTRVLFRLTGADASSRADALADRIWNEFDRIGHVFNAFDPNSEVGKLNRNVSIGATGREFPLSADLYQVLAVSNDLFDASQGGFDPTVGVIRDLWRRADQLDRLPDQTEIDQALHRVGLKRLRLSDPRNVSRSAKLTGEPVALDFGGIAKGYAVDRVKSLLRQNGVTAALIALGGEISAYGDNDGKPWRIGIQHPRRNDAIWGTIAVRGEIRVSTSGNYKQPLRIGGKSYYHIFDPRTGRPVPTTIEGITTLDANGQASSALVDGVTKAIAVIGPSGGLEIAQRLGIEALVIVSDERGTSREIMTKGFQAYYINDTKQN